MKIIGSTGDGYVVTLGKDELAQLAGYSCGYGMERQKGNPPRVGDVVPVTALYKEATETVAAYSEIRKSLTTVTNQTARLLSLMAPIGEEKKP